MHKHKQTPADRRGGRTKRQPRDPGPQRRSRQRPIDDLDDDELVDLAPGFDDLDDDSPLRP